MATRPMRSGTIRRSRASPFPRPDRRGNVGEVITKNLVVMGDPHYSTQPGHPRGAYLRAYDQKTGDQVGAVYMPAPQSRLAHDLFL